ncbi:MAG: hypothetical protein EXR58_04295 [Chloroflexi bacterium]|nr:hypothetical protein [Chloroflexota bacterium]
MLSSVHRVGGAVARLLPSLAFVLLSTSSVAPVPVAAEAACRFQLGFLAIQQQIPVEVGGCLEDEYFNTGNGNAEQHTAAAGNGGLLVWRKADNWTAYTDGYRSWVNGPFGLESRLNTERFPWENDPPATPTPVVVPTSLPTFTPFATAIPSPSATATPNVPTVYITWSIDPSTGAPSGYWRDQNGVVVNFSGGQSFTIVVRFRDQIVLDPSADQFSLLFDCGPSNPSITPCNFNASFKGSLPLLTVINRDPIGGFLSISGPNRYGGQRPDNASRYVNDPKVTLFLNPNPK